MSRHSDETTMTRRRQYDPPQYDPSHERRTSPWNALDTASQRVVAWASAIAVIITVCAWASQTIHIDERVTKLEIATAEAKAIAKANLAVTCILARKVDPTVEPEECHGR